MMHYRTLLRHPDQMPRLYALICDGYSMQPEYADGQPLLFSTTEPWRAGDTVAIYRKPEMIPPEDSLVTLRLLSSAPGADFFHSKAKHTKENRHAAYKNQVIVRTLNPRRSIVLDATTVLRIHKCLGPIEHYV